MATTKKHRGLGRGLDALIPKSDETEQSERMPESNQSREESFAGEVSENGKTEKIETIEKEQSKEDEKDYVKVVRITKIEPNREQPRRQFDTEKLEELADSIAEKGLLEPIIVQESNDHYEIIAGERRWRACKIAGIKEIPVIVRTYDELEKIEISLIENIQREDLNPIEEARAYQRLSEEYHLTQQEIAQKVSKNRASVANSMRLLRLSKQVQEMVIKGTLSMGQARALIPVEEENTQIELAKKIAEENLSVREVEQLIRTMSETQKKKKKEKTAEDPSLTVLYHDIAGKMNASLGMKVSIKQQEGGKGKIEISFSGQDDLEKLMDRLI